MIGYVDRKTTEEDKAVERSPQSPNRSAKVWINFSTSMFALAGILVGSLSPMLFGPNKTAHLTAIVLGGVAGGLLPGLLKNLLLRAIRSARSLVKRHGPREASRQAVSASGVTSPIAKGYRRAAIICGGIGALSVFSIASGLVPSAFSSVLFALISLGAGVFSYRLGSRRKRKAY